MAKMPLSGFRRMPILIYWYVLGIYLIVRPFNLCVGTKTDIEILHKIIDNSFAFLLF